MEHGRDEEAEEVLGDIILAGGDVLSYLKTMMVWKNRVKKQATVIEQWRKRDMIIMAPVNQCRCKKETVMTSPVTEPSLARYIY